jgi:hypothetical protein
VGVGAGLDHVTLCDLLVEERVEADPARAFRIDLTHEREYRKSGLCGHDVATSTVSNRLNAVMKQLALIATIFPPLSWLAGFFGQNFD